MCVCVSTSTIRCKRKHQTVIFQHIVVVYVVKLVLYAFMMFAYSIMIILFFVYISQIVCMLFICNETNQQLCCLQNFHVFPSHHYRSCWCVFRKRQLFKGLSKKIWFLIPDMARLNFLILFSMRNGSDGVCWLCCAMRSRNMFQLEQFSKGNFHTNNN